METGDELKFNACPTAKTHNLLIYFYYFSNRIVANREEENENASASPSFFFLFLQPINLSRHDEQNNKQCRGSEEKRISGGPRWRAVVASRGVRPSQVLISWSEVGGGGGQGKMESLE